MILDECGSWLMNLNEFHGFVMTLTALEIFEIVKLLNRIVNKRRVRISELVDYTSVFFVSDIAMDWSDHAMWWPEKNIWLDKTRWTLDQYNITADATIYFTPMHKTLKIQLPDLRYVDCSVDFSIKTFNSSLALCKELGNIFSYIIIFNLT